MLRRPRRNEYQNPPWATPAKEKTMAKSLTTLCDKLHPRREYGLAIRTIAAERNFFLEALFELPRPERVREGPTGSITTHAETG